MTISSRLKHAWNAFTNTETVREPPFHHVGAMYSHRPDRTRLNFSTERSIIASIYARLAIDFATIDLRHVRLDDQNRYIGDIDSGLNNCLNVEANIDQAPQAFKMDIAMTLFAKGVAAIVPVDTTTNPNITGAFDIQTLRVGEIVAWYPQHVRVNLYNENKGERQEVLVAKKFVAVIENPLYSVMNEPNSTLQRLIRKLNLLDAIDEQSGSGKMDLIIQLPYVIKHESQQARAEQRRAMIESQLKDSKYGIAYTDGTEKITQLNRPVENNLLKQIEYLEGVLYAQLGLTKEVLNGTANEETMTNYYNRTIEPIVTAAVEAMKRSFLTKTARSQKQSVMAFRNPFRLILLKDLAEIADKFTRNEILSSNEIRQFIGVKPSTDPKADQLVNSNMPQAGLVPGQEAPAGTESETSVSTDYDYEGEVEEEDTAVQSALTEAESVVDDIFRELGMV